MPLIDRIRARVREKDCLIALFPDEGVSVLSPMNDIVFPIPGQGTTGSRAVDEGIVKLDRAELATGDAFHFVSGNYGMYYQSIANVAGETPHHTVIFRVFITDLTNVEEYSYSYNAKFGFLGGTAYLGSSNLNCLVELNGQYDTYGIYSYATFQTESGYGSNARCTGSISKAYERSDLSGRWLTVAATVDIETKTHKLYLNGELIASRVRSNWTDAYDRFSYCGDQYACTLGHSYGLASQYYIYSDIAWAACFSSVLSEEEIKYLSEE